MSRAKPPRFTKDGLPDNRGHGEGSKATRFSKDDGRKRPGRPSKASDLKTIVDRVRDMPVPMSQGGKKKRSVSTQEGVLLAQRAKALAGDTKAALFLQNQLDRFHTPLTDPDLIGTLLAEDQAILAAARARGVLPDDEGGNGG
jgi:hypothetical protein